MEFASMLKSMVSRDASDLFIKSGSPPTLRVDAQVTVIDEAGLSAEFIDEVFEQVVKERARKRFEEDGEADVAYDAPDVGRFRVNIFRQKGAIGFDWSVEAKRSMPRLSGGLAKHLTKK